MPRAIAALNSHDGTLLAAPRTHADAEAAVARAAIQISVHEDLVAIESEWRAFERTADCTVFQTFEWLDTWQRHVGTRNDVRPAVVAGRASDGSLAFILPLATRPMPFGRELVFLGTELCDYNGPMLAPGFAAVVPDFAALWPRIEAAVRAQAASDVVHLEKMPAKLGGQDNPMLALGVTPNPSGAYATPLGASWDEFYAAKRSSSTRSRDRGKRKKLAEHGALAFVEPQAETDIVATLDALVAQK